MSIQLSAQEQLFVIKNVSHRNYAMDSISVKELYKDVRYDKYDYIFGKEYKIKYLPSKSTPYLNERPGNGFVYSKNNIYTDLILIYDIKEDKLVSVVNKFGLSAQYIELNKSLIDSFKIEFENIKYQIYHVKFEKEQESFAKDGYYEIPYNGRLKLLLQHQVYSKIEQAYEAFDFLEIFILQRDGLCYKVDKKSRFIKLFPHYKKELKKRMRSYRLSYSKLSRLQMADLTKYAELLYYKGL